VAIRGWELLGREGMEMQAHRKRLRRIAIAAATLAVGVWSLEAARSSASDAGTEGGEPPPKER
jgi:hypothetical protein